MEFTSFPAAVYKNGESKLVATQEEADAAEKEGWSDQPNQDLPARDRIEHHRDRPDQGPADRPERAPHPEQPIAEPPARPKKKD